MQYISIVWLILFLILWAMVEHKQLVTTKYRITSARVPEKLNDTNFVVLADLHNNTFGKNNQRLINRIDKLSPDFIIIAGDMINKKMTCYPCNAFTLLENLSSKYKIYYAYGNHEQNMELIHEAISDNKDSSSKELYSTWVEYKEKLNQNKVTFLSNEGITVIKNGTKIRITGVAIDPKYFTREKITPTMQSGYLDTLIGKKPKEEYHILIAHNPIYFEEYVNWGADLTISGHIHGGMIRIPGVGGLLSPQAKFFPKYHAGIYSENEQKLVVSRGLGSHSVMPRLFNIPELVYVSLKNKS